MPRRHPKNQAKGKKLESEDPTLPVFFYYPNEEPHGIFCQWYPSPFTIPTASVDWLRTAHPKHAALQKANASPSTTSKSSGARPQTITFTCAEQFMMYAKALYFHDARVAALILATPDPAEHKKLGRQVRSFDDHLWTQVRERVAFEGSWYKYTISEEGVARKVLLETRERELCEASPRDKVWGIGFGAEEAVGRRERWGLNLLGKALMRVRKELRRRVDSVEEGEGRWDMPDWEEVLVAEEADLEGAAQAEEG